MNITIQTKLLNFFAKLLYPKKLIPQRDFIARIEVAQIEVIDNIAIVRRSLKNKGESFDKFGFLREDALIIDSKDVLGLSMNLLGNKFSVKHIKFLLNKDAGREWDGKEDNLWKTYKKFISLSLPSQPIYFLLKDLHNITFPYNQNKKDVTKLLTALKIPIPKSDEEIVFEGASVIKHVPTRLNYWHVEFHLLDIAARKLDKPTSFTSGKAKAQYVKKAADIGLRDILLIKAKKHIPKTEYASIPDILCYPAND